MGRPWEQLGVPGRKWENGVFQFRTITITRPKGTGSNAGLQGIQEYNAAGVNQVATGIVCTIEVSREDAVPVVQTPGDTLHRGGWRIFIASAEVNAKGLNNPTAIKNRDFVADDGGARYQVTHAYYHQNGWQLRAERLEA